MALKDQHMEKQTNLPLIGSELWKTTAASFLQVKIITATHGVRTFQCRGSRMLEDLSYVLPPLKAGDNGNMNSDASTVP